MKKFYMMDITVEDALQVILMFFVKEKQLSSAVLKSVGEWLNEKF